jgi:4-amino-4-deoxy-L-arabinose transferase-like glycosyltransferase
MEYLRKLIISNYFYLFLIVLVALFLRFYQLENIPAGFLNDEANAGYDAYSVLLTGKDQWNNFLPVNNFVGFGDFPRPIHRYLLLIPVYLFGLNEFSTRFISALAGVLSVAALYFLVKKLVNRKAAFFSALLLAIMPWAVGLSRIGHESNIAILFLIIALIFGLVQKSSKSLYYVVIFLALSMYTYSAYILYAPLVLIVIFYVNYKKERGYGYLLKPLVLFLILISPIIFQKNAATVRFSQVGLTTNINSIGLINNLNDQRGQCQAIFNPIICKITDNKTVLYTGTFIKNYLSHFSPNFLYTNGTSTQFSILPERGLDYIFNILPLIFGFIFLLRNSKQRKLNSIFVILFLLAPVPDSLTSDGNYVRASIMQPFIAVVTGLGYYYLVNYLINKYKTLKYLILFLVFILISFSLSSFFIVYTTYFKNNYAIYSQYGYRDLMQKTYSLRNDYDKIYISRHLNDAKQYVYYLFYTKYDPRKYQSKKDVSYSVGADGWISVDRVENIYFVQKPPTSSQLEEMGNINSLIISNPVDFPKSIKPVFIVKDKLGNTIFEAEKSSDLLEYNREQKKLRLKENAQVY